MQYLLLARLLVDLIREFFEFYNMEYTLSVLLPEADLVIVISVVFHTY